MKLRAELLYYRFRLVIGVVLHTGLFAYPSKIDINFQVSLGNRSHILRKKIPKNTWHHMHNKGKFRALVRTGATGAKFQAFFL